MRLSDSPLELRTSHEKELAQLRTSYEEELEQLRISYKEELLDARAQVKTFIDEFKGKFIQQHSKYDGLVHFH